MSECPVYCCLYICLVIRVLESLLQTAGNGVESSSLWLGVFGSSGLQAVNSGGRRLKVMGSSHLWAIARIRELLLTLKSAINRAGVAAMLSVASHSNKVSVSSREKL